MATTLPLANRIGQTSSHSRKHNIIETQYGDGFSQVAEFGANAKRDMWKVKWIGMSLADRNTLYSSYDLTTVWNWTAPGDTVEKQWRFTGTYSESSSGNRYSVKMALEQVFIL